MSFYCTRASREKVQWHNPLYLSNNDYWHQRIPIEILNNTGRVLLGDPVRLKIGSAGGQLPIEGIMAESIRLADATGAEYVHSLSDVEGKIIEKGPVPENSLLLIPVECKADTSITYFIYFDNPSAWPMGDYYKTEKEPTDSVTITILRKERAPIRKKGKTDNWPETGDWVSRAPMKTYNFSAEKDANNLVCVDIECLQRRLHSETDHNTNVMVTDEGDPLHNFRIGNFIFYNKYIPANSELNNYIYFGPGTASDRNEPGVLTGVSINYYDFENAGLSGWKGDLESGKIRISGDGKEGKGSIQLELLPEDKGREISVERSIPVNPGKMYFIGAWMKLSDKIDNPPVFSTGVRLRTLRITFLDKDNNNIGTTNSITVIPERYSDHPGTWWFVNRFLPAPANASAARLQLVNAFPGTVLYDDIFIAEVITGSTMADAVERKAEKDLETLTVWQEDPVVKVFMDDLPKNLQNEVTISAARNDVEPLQLVARSPQDHKQLEIKVKPPASADGNKLNDIGIGVVGYVPINFPSNYYGAKDDPNPWRVKYIARRTSGSDGWAGMWPDPIMPYKTFDLKANTTQPIWIEIKVPQDAKPGDYTGAVQLLNSGTVVKEIPFKVHVWDFILPDKPDMTALYDVRSQISDKEKQGIWKLLADHRLAPDRITPEPTWEKVDGKVVYDFTEYDKAAALFFDSLKFSYAYSPGFYLFGWGNPPQIKFGEAPYPGDYPYTNADRSKLRPEFRKVFQSAIRSYWNHMKEKGWDDNILIYISDEPHTEPEITLQMRALCNMIHEVDPKIPVYVSSWWYRPEYSGYIDVWGVSNHGSTWGRPVPISDFTNIRKDGARVWFTTDGKLCTDTPYLGFERMTPHYAFKFGAEAYEFWGCNWYTFNPFDYGWHNHIRQSSSPGRVSWTRYPNGDGYIIYPGHFIGLDSYVPTIRLKLAREGVEDYEFLHYLSTLIDKGKKRGADVAKAEKALQDAKDIVLFPTAEGRFSTEYLPDPYAIMRVRAGVAEAIEELTK